MVHNETQYFSQWKADDLLSQENRREASSFAMRV
jgi:hypothetical protein